jgi:hypothetical protein
LKWAEKPAEIVASGARLISVALRGRLAISVGPMPQKPIVRRRKKARRSKQLAEWRKKQSQEQAASPSSKAPKSKAPTSK